ncbi:MAG TPA: type II secretion system protein GspM [Xanthobacteraceae bacterium]|nr:type II secretion system protein GspM [Xanthobacteraceae bacterium]
MRTDLRLMPALRRGLFVFLNLAACLGILAGIMWPIEDLLADRDRRIAEQRTLVARLAAVAAQAPAIRERSEQTKSLADRPEFLHGPNDGVIAANLQSRLTGMTQSAGSRVRSIRALQPSTRDGVPYLGAHIDMSGPLLALQRAIYAIESATPYLFVVGAVIKPSTQTALQRPGAPNATEQPVFDAELDIVGALPPEARH